MTIEEMKTRRAILRDQFDKRMWRKRLFDQQIDAIAKAIENLTFEIAVSEMCRDFPTPVVCREPLRMELI